MAPKFQISSIESYIDEELTIKVIGCLKNSEVTIHATTYDEEEKKFCSYATFIADHEGMVNVSSQKPIKGTYNQADSSGLFWSMEHAESKWGDYYVKSSSDKVSINLVLKADGKEHDSVTINRYFYTDGVIKETVQHAQVKGTLFHPKRNGRYPAVMILSGSDGGMEEHAAALLASKGYTAFALCYFGAEGVPKDLENIPLEYFQKATMWLKDHPYVNGNVSLIGYSRGGELALLLGATFDYYQSIIAGAPSAYITAGMKNGIFAPVSSWTFNRKALPYIKFTYRFSTMFSILKNWILKKPISYLSIWDNTLKYRKGITEARIPVENIHVPVMFISGEDDQLWPSGRYVKMMEDKLKSTNATQRNRYLYYENAGHFLSFPYSFINMPARVFMNVGGGMTMTFGGSKTANAKAAKDSWDRILQFLEENTGNARNTWDK
ncbi:acyl-CoA thioesterase/bile acid-CoA:amino acid N-acyltransferase family protein [Virgibacillus sp. YIM 98842]|uniref:acyl-CoA thioester hydrolase/BAAT C-terminal domain-containing protein n=1 Tax=Virgibacillus sp. YIM 98842 TaxID=2663533 RepID=UPI0013DCC2AC|nr:acyl-CoA thioesterase/bile acid-CoA:amino acid N-acyltransferase family protein [Virgibacillus sp. YIM 98842]